MNNKLGIYEKAFPIDSDWKFRFETAKKAGFDFIELSVDKDRLNKLDYTDIQINELLNLAEEYKMEFETLTLSANRYFPIGDEDKREKGIELIKKAIVLAKKLNVKIIQLTAYDVYQKESTDKTKQLYKEAILDVLNFNKDYKIILAIEVLEDVDHFNTSEKLMKFIKEINSPYLKEYGDTGNLAYNGFDPVSDLSYCINDLAAIHIKDAVYHNEHNVEYGKGVVNFEGIFDYLKANNYQGFLVSECWYENDYQPDLYFISNFIRRYMK